MDRSEEVVFDVKGLAARAGFASIDALARKTYELWSERAPSDNPPQPRSLSSKIGALRRIAGRGWWVKRPAGLEALCAALDVHPGELGIGGVSTPRGFWSIRECPQLAPIELAHERPCELAEWRHSDSLPLLRERRRALGPARSKRSSRVLFQPYSPHPSHIWTKLAHGWGRSLLARSIAASDGVVLIEAETLQEAIERGAASMPGRVVLTLRRPDPGSDLEALARLRRRGDSFLVLAHHGAPRRDPESQFRRWDEITPRGSHAYSNSPHWEDFELAPRPQWRRRLLHWAAQRTREPFEPEAIASWIDSFDDVESVFACPEDLLSVLSLVLQVGRGRVARKSLVENAFMAAEIATLQSKTGQSDIWLKDDGPDLMIELAQARAQDPSVPLHGPLAKQQWASLVPAQRLPGAVDDSEIVARDALARDSIRRLTAAGLLRGEAGKLALDPGWIARAASGDAIEALVRSDHPVLWGRLAAEPDRRSRIDRVLRGLKADTLTQHIEQALAAPRSLGRAAALDALFVAVGHTSAAIPEPLARELVIAVLDQSVLETEDQLRLLTRGTPRERLEAIIACWAWSIRFPNFALQVQMFNNIQMVRWSDKCLGLAFPGWQPPSAEVLSKQLDSLLGTRTSNGTPAAGRSGDEFRELSYGTEIVHLMEFARAFVDTLAEPWPAAPAPWLVAARLARGSSFGWLTVAALESLCSHERAVRWLSETLQGHAGHQAARAIMNVVAGAGKLSELSPELLWTQKFLEPEDVVALLAAHGYRWCCEGFSWIYVQPRLRLVIAEHALANVKAADWFWSLIFRASGTLGSDDVEVLELLVGSRHSTLGIAASELWRIRPTRALVLAKQELVTRCHVGLACRAASSTGLQDMHEELRAALEDNPPAWLRELLRAHAPAGGPLAELAVRVGS